MKSERRLFSSNLGALLEKPRDGGRAEEFKRRVEVYRSVAKKKRRRARAAALGTAAAIVLLAWAVPAIRQTSSLSIPAGHRESLLLPDGSQAELNARTDASTDFRYGRRTVHLKDGEAFFTVAKDPAHPFEVMTPGGTIQVTGTQFNVRVGKEGTEVTLIDGSVIFDGSDGRAGNGVESLAPGQQSTSRVLAPRTLDPAELSTVTAWRVGDICFDGLTLQQAMARLSRYHGMEIYVDPRLANLRPGGRFPIDDLPRLFTVLESALQVRIVKLASGGYQVLPK